MAEFNRPQLAGDVLAGNDGLPALHATIGFDAGLPAAAMANPFRENNRRVADADELRVLIAA